MVKRGTDLKLKFRWLRVELGLASWEAKGLLQALWDFVAENAPLGDVGRFTDDQIAGGIEWTRTSGAELIEALVKTRWLDRDAEYRVVVHDWHEHVEEWLRKRVARAGETFVTGPNVKRQGVVYFIQRPSTGAIKIGFSQMVETRIETLSRECGERLNLLATIPGDESLEAKLHRQFCHLALGGEWFQGSDEIISADVGSHRQPPAAVGSLPDPDPDPDPDPKERKEKERTSPAAPSLSRLTSDFEEWYRPYPHKVGRRAALKSYIAARKRGATQADLVAGLARYIASKPEDRPWCNPATWLNQDRWQDQEGSDATASGPVARTATQLSRERREREWTEQARRAEIERRRARRDASSGHTGGGEPGGAVSRDGVGEHRSRGDRAQPVDPRDDGGTVRGLPALPGSEEMQGGVAGNSARRG